MKIVEAQERTGIRKEKKNLVQTVKNYYPDKGVSTQVESRRV